MKRRDLILVGATSVLLALSAGTGLLAAQNSKAPAAKAAAAKAEKAANEKVAKKESMAVSRGTIESIADTKLVISEKNNKTGKLEQKTFMLNTETSKAGALAVGNEATVHYRSNGNELMAMSVVGSAPRKSGKPKAATKG